MRCRVATSFARTWPSTERYGVPPMSDGFSMFSIALLLPPRPPSPPPPPPPSSLPPSSLPPLPGRRLISPGVCSAARSSGPSADRPSVTSTRGLGGVLRVTAAADAADALPDGATPSAAPSEA